MSLSPWSALLLSLPVLLLGEWLVRRVGMFSRFNIPAPVVGGLLVSLFVLIGNLSGAWAVRFDTGVTAPWWTWLVTTEPEWMKTPLKNVNLPLLVAFFTCVGLNASWTLVKRGTVQVMWFLGVCGVMAVIQNLLGVGLAWVMGVDPLLGLVCGSVAMTGGHGSVLGFASDFEAAGLKGAAVVGVAAATFGLVAGGLLGGPVGGGIIRRHRLSPAVNASMHLEGGPTGEPGIIPDMRALVAFGKVALWHMLLLLVCVKLGAWVSFWIQKLGITFPVYMGALLLGVAVRNLLDLSGATWIKSEIVDKLSSVLLGIFLVVSMMSLNLIELANAALPMLAILAVQVLAMATFARWITFPAMGRDFDAAIMVGGHCGFGLGAVPNAVANMKSLVERHGPAPRAFLVVPIVGAFLVDIVNAGNITLFLNLLK